MRHAKKWQFVLIALCSLALLSGCSFRNEIPTPPASRKLPDCPFPAAPELALIDDSLPLDDPKNVAALLQRDDAIRFYIDGLRDTIACYRRITKGDA